MIEFKQVSKFYNGGAAVKDLSLTFAEGAFSVLIGTSGSGKSTTLKMINRLVEHDAGEIRFAGEEIRQFSPFPRFAGAWGMRSSRSGCFRTGRWRKTSRRCRSC
ncbi:Osmoprotectant ABC transporter ATP-binding subunit YehX [Cronobacter sakazakii 696]|nr:Osmoprotectant ABC transporter ATP-binding subunit YehX [Cronobacter sakazakii 696]